MARDRHTIGPRASEPEQQDYLVEVVGRDGASLGSYHVRHVHALDAAREAAADLGLVGPWHEYAHAPGVWSMSNADRVVRAEARGADANDRDAVEAESIEQDGVEAERDGKPRKLCPYRSGWRRAAWLEGWDFQHDMSCAARAEDAEGAR